MSEALNGDRVELAVLLYGAAPRKSQPTERDITRAVGSLLTFEKARASETNTAVQGAIGRLVECGQLVRSGARVALTEVGKQRCARELGVTFPNKQKWSTLKKYLLALALSAKPHRTEARKRLPGDLAALILNQREQLIPSRVPTGTQVADALAWRELGGDPRVKPSWPAARRVLLARALGIPPGAKESTLLSTLAAKAVGASRATNAALEERVLAAWCAAERSENGSFPERVLAAAKDAGTERFGANKAFIDSVFRTYQQRGGTLQRSAFEQRLVEAHQAGRLRLARADLVPAMDRELVDRSELAYQNATFHFVEVP